MQLTSEHDTKWNAIAKRLEACRAQRFDDLVRYARLDPARDLRCADFSGVDFSNCDLMGFDFSSTRLHNCRFDRAMISGARFDGAELGAVLHAREIGSHEPAVMTAVADLSKAADWPEYVRGWRKAEKPPPREHLEPGAIFSDAPGLAPELVVVPAGEFWMGASDGSGGEQGEVADPERYPDEGPRHRVTIARPFAVGRFAVTFEEWGWAQEHPEWRTYSGLAARQPSDEDWGRGRRPMINVDWDDAQVYCRWLTSVTGKPYRLPSEAEWEYCCRAGTTTAYATGDRITHEQARFNRGKGTVRVGSYPANHWGLHDMHGNVFEWCQDEWHDSYQGAPADGSAWGSRAKGVRRVLRGGSWDSYPRLLRSAFRFRNAADVRLGYIGFRVVRTLSA
jgi:formylglycine-generating enzyme required for sulfatase activity